MILGGTVILLWDWRLIDPLLTLGISLYILWHAAQEIRPVIRILMLGTPGETNPQDVSQAMIDMPGVQDVHHLHLWQIDEHRCSVEAHVVLEGSDDRIVQKLKQLLKDRFAIDHSTLEIERAGQACAHQNCDTH